MVLRCEFLLMKRSSCQFAGDVIQTADLHLEDIIDDDLDLPKVSLAFRGSNAKKPPHGGTVVVCLKTSKRRKDQASASVSGFHFLEA